jgi:hypothetical protein
LGSLERAISIAVQSSENGNRSSVPANGQVQKSIYTKCNILSSEPFTIEMVVLFGIPVDARLTFSPAGWDEG